MQEKYNDDHLQAVVPFMLGAVFKEKPSLAMRNWASVVL